MGGEISVEDLNKLPREPLREPPAEPKPRWQAGMLAGLSNMAHEADRENAAEAVKLLTEIALETDNSLLAESCRNCIGLILIEYARQKQEQTANEN